MEYSKNDHVLTGKVMVVLLVVASTLVGALLFSTFMVVRPAPGLTIALSLSGLGASLFLGLACAALLCLLRRPAIQRLKAEG